MLEIGVDGFAKCENYREERHYFWTFHYDLWRKALCCKVINGFFITHGLPYHANGFL